jgi:hypothetical protein
MADCESFLRQVVRRIEPSQAQKDAASRSHNYLRDVLVTGRMAQVIVDSYLSGSYARDTAVSPLDDVDIVFLIHPKHWQNVIQSFLGLRPSPQDVLNTFARAIRYRYDQSAVNIQRRSVRLQLFHLDIDVVPALPSSSDGQMILVGDAEADAWLDSAPKKHEALATEVNRSRGGLFKPLVKLLKFWNGNLPTTANVKSFAIETMAVRIFRNHSFEALQQGILKFFDFVCHLAGGSTVYEWGSSCGMSFSWLSGRSVPDAAGTGSNLFANVDGERLKRFVENAARSRDKMRESVKATFTDTSERRAAEALRM